MAEKTIWNAAFVGLLAFEGMLQFSACIVSPLISSFAVALGASVALAGFLTGFKAVCMTVVRPFGGLFFSRFRKKSLLIASAFLFAFSSFSCVVAPSLGAIGLAQALFGVAFVFKSSLIIAMAAAAVPKECVGQGVGIIGVTNVVANAIGPGIGAWISSEVGYGAAFLLSAILCGASIVLAVRIDDAIGGSESGGRDSDASGADQIRTEDAIGERGRESQGCVRRIFSRLIYARALPVAGLVFFEGFVFGTVTLMVLLVGEQRGVPTISSFFVIYAVVAFALRSFVGKAYDRFGFAKLFAPSLLAFGASCVALAYVHDSVLSVALCAVLFALGQSTIFPWLQAESVRGVSETDTVLAANTFCLGADIGMAECKKVFEVPCFSRHGRPCLIKHKP